MKDDFVAAQSGKWLGYGQCPERLRGFEPERCPDGAQISALRLTVAFTRNALSARAFSNQQRIEDLYIYFRLLRLNSPKHSSFGKCSTSSSSTRDVWKKNIRSYSKFLLWWNRRSRKRISIHREIRTFELSVRKEERTREGNSIRSVLTVGEARIQLRN